MNKRHFFALGVLGLFLIVATTGLVSANPIDTIGKFLGDFLSGDISKNNTTAGAVSKGLLIVLVVLLVYSISEMLPFMGEKEGIKWTFSIIVAILSFMYIKVATINSILANYEALGVILTTIIPLMIIIAAVVQMSIKHPLFAIFANPILVIGFFLYTLFNWNWSGKSELDWVYPLTLLLSLLWLLTYKSVLKVIGKEDINIIKSAYEKEIELSDIKRKTDAKSVSGTKH